MTRKRVDDNQSELVSLWRSMGGSWHDLSQCAGSLDGLAGAYGVTEWIEIKDGAKPPSARKLTAAEQRIFETWQGRTPVIWETRDDVIDTRRALLREAEARAKITWPA